MFQCAGLVPLPLASDPQAEHFIGQEKLGSTIWGAQKSASADPGSLHPFLYLLPALLAAGFGPVNGNSTRCAAR